MTNRSIPTDATLQSTLDYGTSEFPFAYYRDDLDEYQSRCIEWHWHNRFEFSYVLRGTVTCHIGGEQTTLTEGDGLFINSGMIHRFETDSQVILANFIFAPEFLAETSSAVYLRCVLPVLSSSLHHAALRRKNAAHAPLLELLHRLEAACHTDRFGKELLIRNRLSELWYGFVSTNADTLARQIGHRENLTTERLQNMMDFIHTNYHHKLSLGEIAASANISKSEALRCFRLGIQATPVQYLNAYRLGRAREALLSSSDSISNISAAAGFESAGYFCQAFKKSMGCPPNAFRTQMRSSPHPDAPHPSKQDG